MGLLQREQRAAVWEKYSETLQCHQSKAQGSLDTKTSSTETIIELPFLTPYQHLSRLTSLLNSKNKHFSSKFEAAVAVKSFCRSP